MTSNIWPHWTNNAANSRCRDTYTHTQWPASGPLFGVYYDRVFCFSSNFIFGITVIRFMMLSHTLSQLGKSQMFAIIHKLTRHQRLHSTPNGCREILRIVSQFWYLITNLFKTSQNLTKSFSDFYYLLLWRFLLTECAQRFWVGNVSGFFLFLLVGRRKRVDMHAFASKWLRKRAIKNWVK